MRHFAVLSCLTGYCAALPHVSITSVCRCGSLCVSVGPNVSVPWTQLQLVPLVSHEDVLGKCFLFHFIHLHQQEHVWFLPHCTCLLPWLCLLLCACQRWTQWANLYISYKYILMACYIFDFLFVFIWEYVFWILLLPTVPLVQTEREVRKRDFSSIKKHKAVDDKAFL